MPTEIERELLPCPFCGTAEPQVVEQYAGTKQSQWSVICNGHWCDASVSSDGSGSLESAIETWNRRTDAAALQAQQPGGIAERIEELEEICGEAHQVVGSLLSDLGQFDSEHARKILDNLGKRRMVHKDVMATWPSFAQQPGAQAVAWIGTLPNGLRYAHLTEPVAEEGYKEIVPLYTHPQPLSTPEPSEADVDAGIIAADKIYHALPDGVDEKTGKASVVRGVITTDRARLRERIGGGA